jgi:UPF0755 protein
MIKKLFLAAFFSAVILGGWLVYFSAQPLALPASPFEFELRQGSTLKGVAHQLRDAKVLAEPWSFVMLGRLLGKQGQVKAGNYELESGLTSFGLLMKITRGDVTQEGITFIEGWNFRQMRAALDAQGNLRHDSQGMSEAEILAAIGAGEQQAEGLFLPDTYYFSKGGSDLALLKRAYQGMQKRLARAWDNRDPAVPYTDPYQALIMASIVEKETGKASERPMIAGVFLNRLRIGMRLQTDPTVIYGLGERFDGNLRKADLLADTPYNTYTRTGLPPTPIAMPGKEAIEAALHPERTKAMYFVAKGGGAHYFSTTLAEHNAAVARYQLRRQ